MDFEAIAGKNVWPQLQQNLERVQSLMCESQGLAAKINGSVAPAYESLERTPTAEEVSGSGLTKPCTILQAQTLETR